MWIQAKEEIAEQKSGTEEKAELNESEGANHEIEEETKKKEEREGESASKKKTGVAENSTGFKGKILKTEEKSGISRQNKISKKLFQKINRKNRSSGRMLYLGSTLVTAFLFTFISLYISFHQIQKSKGMYGEDLVPFLYHGIFLMALIGMLIFSLAFKPYVNGRRKDYILLHTLGMPKSFLNGWILKEYVWILVQSLFSGYFLGSGLYFGVEKGLQKLYPLYYQGNFPKSWVYGISLLVIVFLVVEITLLNYEVYTETEFAHQGKGARIEKFSWKKRYGYYGGIGIGLLIVSISGYIWKTNRESAYLLLSGMLGVFLLFISGFSYVLKKRKSKADYYKNLPKLYTFYVQYKKYRRLVLTTLALHGFFLSYILLRGLTFLPLEYISNQFPFEYVVLGDSEKIFEEIEERFSLKGTHYKMVSLTVPSIQENNTGSRMDIDGQGQQIGISASTYEKITKEKLSLSGKEIGIFYQKDKGEVAHPLDFTTLFGSPRMKVGVPGFYLWYKRDEVFASDYKIKVEKRKNILGQLVGGRQEHLVVLSDDYFQKVYQQEGFPSYFGTYRLTKETNRKEWGTWTKSYKEEKQFFSVYDKTIQPVYDCQNIVEQIESLYLMKLFFYSFLGGLFQLGVLYVFVWRMNIDGKDWKERMYLYETLGMNREKIWKILRREHSLPYELALGFSLIFSTVFAIGLMWVRDFCIWEQGVFLKYMIPSFLIYGGVHWILIRTFEIWMVVRLERSLR